MAVITDSGLRIFLGQLTPRQICVQTRYQDSTVATVGTVIAYFHAPHGTTKDEVRRLRADLKQVIDILMESFPAERTGDAGDILRANLVGSSPPPIESQIASRNGYTWREIDRPRGLLPGLPLTLEAGRQQSETVAWSDA
jgi:hypothetical protein